jgi:hypothetical protein
LLQLGKAPRAVRFASAVRLGSIRTGSLSLEVRTVVCRNCWHYRRTQAIVNHIPSSRKELRARPEPLFPGNALQSPTYGGSLPYSHSHNPRALERPTAVRTGQ